MSLYKCTIRSQDVISDLQESDMKKTFIKAVALMAALSVASINLAFAGGSIGHGDISVLDDKGQITTKLSGQNPVEDGALLVCDGKCMLKSQGISIVAEPGSKIAVTNESDIFKLYVQEGTVNYIINSNARKIAFYTPNDTYMVAEIVFNAAGSSSVKGFVVVDKEGKTEITVTEGRLVFATADGMKTVDANQKIVLAQGNVQGSNDPDYVVPLVGAAGFIGIGFIKGGSSDKVPSLSK